MEIGYTYIALSGRVHPITWTIPNCGLVLKLIGKLSFIIIVKTFTSFVLLVISKHYSTSTVCNNTR